MRFPAFSAALVFSVIAPLPDSSRAAVISQVDGNATVNSEGVLTPAAEKSGELLLPGVIVQTNENGRALLKMAEGFFIELQPETQIILGGLVADGGADTMGNPLPQAAVTLVSGSLVVVTTSAGLDQASLLVVTPRGNLSPVNAGQVFVVTDSADPSLATVTVAVLTGDTLVTKTGGDATPVGEGLAMALKADGQSSLNTFTNLPENSLYTVSVQSTVAKIDSLAGPALVPMQTLNDPAPTPTPRATPTPRPTPTPTPTPRPTPSPTPTPRPTPTPTPTPRPTPSPTPTPRPTPTPTPTPRPTPTPTPTPRPTPTPTPTPRPTPTPSPTQTP